MMVVISVKAAFWVPILMRQSWGLTSCTSTSVAPPTDGMACQPFDFRNVSAATRHHCSLACVPNNNCRALIYDATQHVCMLLTETCMLLHPYPGYVYHNVRITCTTWEAEAGSENGFFYHDGFKLSGVARTSRDGDIVVGRTHSRFYGISSGGESFMSGSFERLVVDPSCDVTWVSHDSSTGQPLPTGALIGGIVTTTNTPLYVVRSDVQGYMPSGYFNPLNNLAWAEWLGVYYITAFEVMVVVPR